MTYTPPPNFYIATSSTRPPSVEGRAVYETDTKVVSVYNNTAWRTLYLDGAWTAWTPTITGTGWALGNGTATGTYRKVGRMVDVNFLITFGTTSTFGTVQPSVASLPFAFARAFTALPIGTYNGASIWQLYASPTASGTTLPLLYLGEFAAPGATFTSNISNTSPGTAASGNTWAGSFSYEATT